MVIRNQNSTKTGRRKEQRSCNNTEENCDHKRILNMDHLILHLILESSKQMERNGINDPMEPSGDEGNVVFYVHQRKDIRRKL